MFGVGALAQICFAIITLLIAFFALRIYKITKLENYQKFTLAFFFIAAAYLFKSFINLLFFLEFLNPGPAVETFSNLAGLYAYGSLVHIVLMLLALLILVNLILKIKNKKVFILLLILTFIPLLITNFSYSVFYLLASILLAILVIHFYHNYQRIKSRGALVVSFAFLFILIGQILFIFTSYTPHFFVWGHILEFLGYVALLFNYIMVLRK